MTIGGQWCRDNFVTVTEYGTWRGTLALLLGAAWNLLWLLAAAVYRFSHFRKTQSPVGDFGSTLCLHWF